MEASAAQQQLDKVGRGLHSSTFQLNVSAFCGIGGAFMGWSGDAYEVLGGIRGCSGCYLCQKRLNVSWKMDECKPLKVGLENRKWAYHKLVLPGEYRAKSALSVRLLDRAKDLQVRPVPRALRDFRFSLYSQTQALLERYVPNVSVVRQTKISKETWVVGKTVAGGTVGCWRDRGVTEAFAGADLKYRAT